MACEVDNSLFSDALLDDSWAKAGGVDDSLNAIMDFNDNFGQQNGGGGIDPLSTLSNPSTPQSNNNNNINNINNNSNDDDDPFNFDTTTNRNGLDQTLSPDPVTYETYPNPFHIHHTPSSPYFPSVENNPLPLYHPSSLRNEQLYNTHRRSVSEPPGMPPPNAPPMMFHRENHFLGTPVQQAPTTMQLKSLPKAPHHHTTKSSLRRHHPYAKAAVNRSLNQPPPAPHSLIDQQQQQRHQSFTNRSPFTRARTQPSRSPLHNAATATAPLPPTSAPVMPPQQPLPPPAPQYHRPRLQGSSQQQQKQYSQQSTRRVCTPTPDGGSASFGFSPPLAATGTGTGTAVPPLQQPLSSSLIDPTLLSHELSSSSSSPDGGAGGAGGVGEKHVVSIPLTVDELRVMIFTAVRDAVAERKQGEGEGEELKEGGGKGEEQAVVEPSGSSEVVL